MVEFLSDKIRYLVEEIFIVSKSDVIFNNIKCENREISIFKNRRKRRLDVYEIIYIVRSKIKYFQDFIKMDEELFDRGYVYMVQLFEKIIQKGFY